METIPPKSSQGYVHLEEDVYKRQIDTLAGNAGRRAGRYDSDAGRPVAGLDIIQVHVT